MDRMDTLINGEYILVDLDTVWAETFAHWDRLVETPLAEKIATATEQVLRDKTHEKIKVRGSFNTY